MPPNPPSMHSLDDSSNKRSDTDSTFNAAASNDSTYINPASGSVKSLALSLDDGSISVASASVRNATIKTTVRKSKKAVQKRFSDDFLPSEARMHPVDFQSIPLVGRDKEVSALKACYTRLIETPKEKQLVLIPGVSGAGKSAVAATLAKEVISETSTNGIFVTGKFDMNTSSEPYSGICKAFGSMCQTVQESSAEIVGAVQASISEQLGSDVDLLVHLIPELKGLVPDTINDPTVTDIGAADEIESKLERLRFAFRVLMRVFCSVFSPVVLFLDDLQWADISSLQVLEFLISDAQNENALMIMGCYRSDEVDENSLLYNKMVALEAVTDKYKFHMTKIPVGAFGLNEIEQVISAVLPNPNVAATLGLAKICLKRTLGNPFFVLEFLKMLHHEGLVQCDASEVWTWDVSKVDAETMSTANVVVMLHNQLTKLPDQVQSLLQCAAYLGSTFAETTIDLVWTTYGRRLVESKIEKTTSLLEIIVKEEIVEKCDNGQYRWVHDKLQEAALSLTGERRESFQLDIGRTLYYGLDQKQVEDELFAIVDLINNGNIVKLSEFANANLRAAEKARDLSAFQSAAEYAAHGSSLLKDDKWSTERELTLKLYTIGAEMEAISGNADVSNRYIAEVFSQTDLTPMETLPLKIAKASTIGSADLKFDESVKYYLRLLNELGCRVTWARRLVPVQAIIKLTRIVKRAKALPPNFYDTLVPIEDPRQKAIASVFSKLVYYAFIAGDMLLYTLSICRLAEMTMDHGINEFSAKAFASIGCTVIIVMEDFESSKVFANIALSMLKKFRGMHACETTFLACCPGQSWWKPFEELHVFVGNSVVEGLRSGDNEFAMWNLVSSKLTMTYAMGRPISSLLKECPSIRLQCEDASQLLNAMAAQVIWQMLLNLQGTTTTGNPAELEGEVFSVSKDEETTNVHLSFVHFAQTELALFNGNDYEAAAQRALKLGDVYFKLIPAYLLIMVELFHRAVPLFAAARLTKKRKYRGEARRLLKRMDKWIKAGNVNVEYYFLLLTAENLALDKKYDAAEEKYKDAIVKVTAKGHLHHLGLIHERYGDFLMEERSDKEKAKEYWGKALQYYRDWGADVKVKQLESKF